LREGEEAEELVRFLGRKKEEAGRTEIMSQPVETSRAESLLKV
jgi:hypothetical protein